MNQPATAMIFGSAMLLASAAVPTTSQSVSLRLATIELEPDQRATFQDIAKQLIAGKVGPIILDDEIEFKAVRNSDHVHITWQGKIEADGPFVNPDVIDARVYEDRAEVGLRIGKVVIR